jgi:hypothetical protein
MASLGKRLAPVTTRPSTRRLSSSARRRTLTEDDYPRH